MFLDQVKFSLIRIFVFNNEKKKKKKRKTIKKGENKI